MFLTNATPIDITQDPIDILLGRVNTLLLAVLLLLSTYIFGLPFWSEVSVLYLKSIDKTSGYVYKSSIALEKSHTLQENTKIEEKYLKPIPKENVLVIPKINVDAKIVEGEDPSALYDGFWRRPKTSKPPLGGNTVISGHRFLYTSGPNTLYHLDRVKVGDEILIFWEGTEYVYIVSETKIVQPNAIEIEAPTDDHRLTLYTCTPLWSSAQRLVVVARPKV